MATSRDVWERAASLLGALDALQASIGAPVPASASAELEELGSAVRMSLGPEAFERSSSEGEATTVRQAVEYALEDAALP